MITLTCSNCGATTDFEELHTEFLERIEKIPVICNRCNLERIHKYGETEARPVFYVE